MVEIEVENRMTAFQPAGAMTAARSASRPGNLDADDQDFSVEVLLRAETF